MMTVLLLQCVGFGTVVALPLAFCTRIMYVLYLRRKWKSVKGKRFPLRDVKLLNAYDVRIYIDPHDAKQLAGYMKRIDGAFRYVDCLHCGECDKKPILLDAWVRLAGALECVFKVEAKDG